MKRFWKKSEMKFPVLHVKEPGARSLTMEEYADFVDFFIKNADQQLVKRQKEREEQITERFCLVADKGV